ncbi:MAG TPA: type IV pilus assembly protein PilM [Chthoniobacteraceae bacterium]|nr:type IV pilus assembly protein PilM [Chthoniobacteraceae bacterium]
MAAPQRIFTLSLGSQTVRLAEFHSDKNGGLILWNYQTSELLSDPAADAARVGQTAIAVQELVGNLKAGGSSVNYSIPAQSVFTRFVRLPSVGEEKIEQIVTFEAQQNVPFPIDEVVWDYQLVTSNDPEKLEVVLVAIKSDLLEELNSAVEDSGARTDVVDVAPMALYNAFRYNYSDVGGCSLLIDIGARTTNLVFVEEQKVFSRSIPIGGNTITAAIAKDFDENFTIAEARKKEQAFVSLGGAYAAPDDEEVARVSKMVRNTMTRLHAEISRSISFYRSQQGGKQPDRVYLCGGSVGMPYMREFFNEKLALPIEFFNPLRNVSVGGSIDAGSIGKEAHVLGELVGLGLRSSSSCPMELNLRPPSVIRTREMEARRPFFALASAALLLILASWFYFFHHNAKVQEEVLAKLEPKVSALEALQKKFNATEAQRKTLQAAAQPLLDAVTERDYWLRLLDDLNERLPKRYIWITSISVGSSASTASAATPARRAPARPGAAAAPASKPTLVVKGLYLANPQEVRIVDEFATALAQSPFFSIDLEKKNIYNPVRTTQNNTEWTFPYELQLPLNDPTELPAPEATAP